MRLISNLLPVAASLILICPLAADAKPHSDPNALASLIPAAAPAGTTPRQSSAKKKHVTRGVTQIEIDAPTNVVWSVLTDFQQYPQIFNGIQSCRVTKREGGLVFTESYLKPHMFLSEPCQHVVNDLSAAPQALTWHALDGNFKSLDGKWELKPMAGGRCLAVYTLAVDPGALVPGPLVGFALHNMQKEIVVALKKSAESRCCDVKTSTVPMNANAG